MNKNLKDIISIDKLMYQNINFKSIGEMDWKSAKEYAKNLTLGGYNDWRLPTRYELNQLANIELYGESDENWEEWFKINKIKRLKNSIDNYHFIREEFLENMPRYSWFWTDETYKENNQSWVVYFDDGNDDWDDQSDGYFVCCVREQT